MNLSKETLDYLNEKHGLVPFDLSALADLITLKNGFVYEFQKGQYNIVDYVICKCGFLLTRNKHKYGISCPLCGNKKFTRHKSLKSQEEDIHLTRVEQKELLFERAREIKLVSDLFLDFDVDNKKVKLGKFKISYKLDVVRKKIHVVELVKDIYEFQYKNGLWWALNEDGTAKDIQGYTDFFIVFNGLFSSIPYEKGKVYIEEFLTNYNLIVEKEKQIKNFEGFTMQSLFISLISRNFYVICEYFQESFSELYYLDIYKSGKHSSKLSPNDKVISKKILKKFFKDVPLNLYNFETIDKQFNYFSKQHIMGNESMTNGSIKHENVYKILELPKIIVKELKNLKGFKQKNKTYQFAALIKLIKDNMHRVELSSFVELIKIFGVNLDGYNYVFRLMEHHPTKKPEKIASYLNWFDENGYIHLKDAYTLYKDYISMSNQLNLNHNIFPKNLRKVHDIRLIDFNIMKEEEYREKEKEKAILFKKIYKQPSQMDIDEQYTMIKPESPYDLMKEGQELRHCVGSYAQAVLNQTSLIFFLRKKNDVKKSLVTVELNPKSEKVVQKKGKFNRSTTKDENEAINLWYEKYIINKAITI